MGLASTNTTTSITSSRTAHPTFRRRRSALTAGSSLNSSTTNSSSLPGSRLITGFRATQFNATISETADRSTLWRRLTHPTPELGLQRLLWVLLPGAALGHGHRTSARPGQRPESYVRSSARRARHPMAIRRHHPLPQLDPQHQQLRDQGGELARPQQYRRIEYLLADHLVVCAHSRVVSEPALSRCLPSWPVPSRLRQPDRAGDLARSPGALSVPAQSRRLPARHSARTRAGRPRSEKHLERGLRRHSSTHKFTASTNVYYGSGFTNGLYGTPQAQYPGPYLPGHTTFDLSVGKTFGDRYTVSVNALNVANRPRAFG